MRQLIYFLAAMTGGLLLHQTASLTLKMPKGWQHLAGPTIGVEGAFPFFVLFLKRMGFDKEAIFRISLIYQTVFLCVGLGVALGWTLDTLFDIDRTASSQSNTP